MWHPGHLPLRDHTRVLLNMHRFDTSVPHLITRVRCTRIIVTLDIVSKVLHILRVTHLDYPSCDRLRTVSKDEL